MLDVVDGLLEQVAHVRVVQRVHGSPADAFAYDEPEMSEESQLMRHGGLLHSDGLCELANRARCFSQASQDANAASGGERLHRLGHLASRLGVQTSETRGSAHTVGHCRIICTVFHLPASASSPD